MGRKKKYFIKKMHDLPFSPFERKKRRRGDKCMLMLKGKEQWSNKSLSR